MESNVDTAAAEADIVGNIMSTESWERVILKRREYDYWVSDLGRVRNMEGKILRTFMRGQRKGSYTCVKLYRHGRRVAIDIHRLVALHFVPNPDHKPEVNHLDCDHMNAAAYNLEWCTRSENERHKIFMNAFNEFSDEISLPIEATNAAFR